MASVAAVTSSTSMKKVILVIGAGAGIGSSVAKRFAEGGYHACLCRRSDDKGLQESVKSIERAGGSASGFLMDASKPNTIEDMVQDIENNIGAIDVCVYNLGAQIGNRSLDQTSYKQFELGWRMGTFGLFRLSKSLLPLMQERGSGSLLVTNATSAVRGNAGQLSHAAAMGGRRMLCQSLNAEFASKGVHISHILIDGAVDSPDTLGKMVGAEQLQEMRQRNVLMDPAKIAETYWHLAHQDSSTRTFELDLRNQNDVAWWNSRL
jgi:NAD(P)-dependent dehydrogenase (short-subunit alcohol dehydrogenase family)